MKGVNMANKNLFSEVKKALLPKVTSVNEAGGIAYALTSEQSLAQYAMTGCLNGVYYSDAEKQLEKVLQFAENVDPEVVAKIAVYGRERGYMKDVPSLLCAILSKKDTALLNKVFDRVVDNGKMLRNFVQIMRSGATGRKSLGTAPKRMVQKWFEKRSDDAVFCASVGNDPSFADIIRMVHPKPDSKMREAMYGYFIGKEVSVDSLPKVVQEFECFKKGNSSVVPEIPFQFLTSMELTKDVWKQIAGNASWQMTRMNLNTFMRHGVFEDKSLTALISERLRSESLIKKAKVFPYQLMVAYTMLDDKIPGAIGEALQDAMEIAISNVPSIKGKVYVCPDVSGSMDSSVSGVRKGATSKVRCIDVAALMAAAILRNNPDAEVIPFSDNVVKVKLNPRDTVITNAKKLTSLPRGGTRCSAPLRMLNREMKNGDMVIMISDNESWVETKLNNKSNVTETMKEWQEFKYRNQNAKMVSIDIQPYASSQVQERMDILNVGGFSDQVFDIIDLFAKNKLTGEHWMSVIKEVVL
jgi:60 kDa SS-A/Ro ribonucleoprotein